MGIRLHPIEASFYGLFAEAAAHLVDGVAVLTRVMNVDADHASIAQQMADVEHRADETTHQIVKRVNSTFITPFDRDDIYALAGGLDDVVDHMEEAVDLIHLYGVKTFPSEFAAQVDVLQRAVQLTAEAMPRLRTMKGLEDYWIEINRLENQGDKFYRRILADLFGGTYKTLDVLKLKDIVDSVEKAIDALESVANTVEQITVKES